MRIYMYTVAAVDRNVRLSEIGLGWREKDIYTRCTRTGRGGERSIEKLPSNVKYICTLYTSELYTSPPSKSRPQQFATIAGDRQQVYRPAISYRPANNNAAAAVVTRGIGIIIIVFLVIHSLCLCLARACFTTAVPTRAPSLVTIIVIIIIIIIIFYVRGAYNIYLIIIRATRDVCTGITGMYARGHAMYSAARRFAGCSSTPRGRSLEAVVAPSTGGAPHPPRLICHKIIIIV